ncbi:MAG: hypothetical protein HKO82_05460 [Acidimicrobiia bacterium]|nr:hypothetical protein [Acidimicrobiia bacterium]NNF88692.1 hypothetical protein [Acidimicrobiia bacterium]NNL13118.1 hypothetical protein [Acidimicrobiia bacterium]
MKKLIKLAFLVGGVVAVAKVLEAKKAEWAGLGESEVRAKLDARLPEQMPAEKRSEIADKVVGKMREKGVLGEDAPTEALEEPSSD